MSKAAQDPAVFQAIVALLEPRVGSDQAITIDHIQAATGLAKRRYVEEILEVRLSDFPFAVVSSGFGYYRPASPDDLNHCANSLRSRIRCLAVRLRTIRRAAVREGWARENGRFVRLQQQKELFHDYAPALRRTGTGQA